jgi:hypothetical protein
MKKVIKHPDGSEEVIEGTADEIAEYERQLKEDGKPKSLKEKPVLHGAEVDGKPLTDEEINLICLFRIGVPYRLDWPEPTCWACGQKNCRQLHIWCGTQTFTSDNTLSGGSSKLFYSLDDILMG